MRKVIVLLLMCLFVCGLSWAASPFEEKKVEIEGRGAGGYTGVVNVGNSVLNVRTGPWGSIVTQLKNNTKVNIIGSSGDWYKISLSGKTRYVHKNYVKTGSAASSKAAKAPAKKTGKVKTNGVNLNVRSGPWGAIVGKLSHNASVTILGQSGDWYKISYGGKTRYVHKSYVSTSSSSTATKTTTAAKKTSTPSTYKASVVGKRMGDGTTAGAVTWARDQINGTKNGYNVNNGKTSKSSTAWDMWCLAFVNTAYGRKKPLLAAPSAIQSYYKCKAAGKIRLNKNPPAGAAMFTGTLPGNPYGHVFLATGKMNGPNDPIIITTTSSGVKEMPLSHMWKGPAYLGWAMP